MKQKQQGFSLIEMVIAIVILAVLAGIALPKYLDMVDEAKISALTGLAGTVKTSADFVHFEAKLQGLTAQSEQTINIKGTDIQIWGGHPTGHWGQSIRYMLNLDDINFTPSNTACTSDWCGRGNYRRNLHGLVVQPGRISKIFPRGSTWEDQCGVYYINREDGSLPEVGVLTEDC